MHLTASQRTKAVAFARTLTENIHLAPNAYERLLLNRFVRGVLTLDEVEERLARHRRR